MPATCKRFTEPILAARSYLGLVCASIALACLVGCAPTQMIGLAVEPEPVVMFVDGERVDELPPEIELTANRDHTVFFKREGYRSQLVVLRTSERDGVDRLSPEKIELRLKRVTDSTPGITVELEEALDPDAPKP